MGAPLQMLAPFWASNVVLLCALLLVPERRWWAFVLAMFPAHLAAGRGLAMPWSQLLLTFACNGAVALLNAAVLRRVLSGAPWLGDLGTTSRYLLITAGLSLGLVAFAGGVVPFLGDGDPSQSWSFWWRWSLANALGSLILIPVVLLAAFAEERDRAKKNSATVFLDMSADAAPGRSLARGAEQPQLALEAAGIGTWEWNHATNDLRWSPEAYRLFGVDLEVQGAALYAAWLRLLHPDDRDRVGAVILASLEAHRRFAVQFRIRRHGERRWMLARWKVIDSSSARPEQLIGVIFDITENKQVEESLRVGEARFRAIADSAPVLIWASGLDKGCTYFNKPWLDFTGRTMDQECGDGWAEGVHPDDFARCLEIYVSHFDRRAPFRMEYRLRRADGEYRWIDDSGVPRFTPDGTFAGYIGGAVDVAERRRAEESLSRSEARFRAMAETVPEILFTMSPAGDCEYLSSRFNDYTGLTPAARLDWAEALLPDEREGILSARRRAMRAGESFAQECRLRAADGSSRWHVVRWNPIHDANGRTQQWFGAITDVDELKRAAEELRELTVRLLATQDEERRRIARELHDSTAQNLLGAEINIERALRLSPNISVTAASALEESRQLIEQSQREIRTVAYLLHPPMLDEIGLPSTLGWYVDGFAKRAGIAVGLEVSPELTERRLPTEIETALFRVVQEALTNVHRHSGSSIADIRLAYEPAPSAAGESLIMLEIADEGRGIAREPNGHAVTGRKTERGIVSAIGVGLPGMRERVRQLGGRLDIRSSAQGTTVRVTVPLDEDVKAPAEHYRPPDGQGDIRLQPI